MKKYLMMGALLLCISLASAGSQPADMWTYYKYQTAFCKGMTLQSAFINYADPNCMSQDTYMLLQASIFYMTGEGQALYQMQQTASAASECYDGTVDYACLAYYRSQFRSQQAAFNSLVTNTARLSLQAGREAMANQCITRQEFSQYYSMYMYQVMMCNGGIQN